MRDINADAAHLEPPECSPQGEETVIPHLELNLPARRPGTSEAQAQAVARIEDKGFGHMHCC